MKAGLTVTSSVSPPARWMKSHAARSAITLDSGYAGRHSRRLGSGGTIGLGGLGGLEGAGDGGRRPVMDPMKLPLPSHTLTLQFSEHTFVWS
jgi:hypothetical protein